MPVRAPWATPSVRLAVEDLESRLVPNADLIAAFNAGIDRLKAAAGSFGQVKVAPSVPFLGGVAEVAAALGAVFVGGPDPAVRPAGPSEDVGAALARSGYVVDLLDRAAPSGGAVLRVHRDVNLAPKRVLLDTTGKQFFERIDGRYAEAEGFAGRLSADAGVTVRLSAGVLRKGDALAFFVSAGDSTVTLGGIRGQVEVAGGLSIGGLGRVAVSGTLKADFALRGTLQDPDGSGTITADEFADTGLVFTAAGTTKAENVRFRASRGFKLDWVGDLEARFAHDGSVSAHERLTLPDLARVLSSVAGKVFATVKEFNPWSSLSPWLTKEIPLLKKSVADLLGLNAKVAEGTPTAPAGDPSGWTLQSLLSTLSSGGFKLGFDPKDALAVIGRLVHGERQTLVRYDRDFGKSWTIRLTRPLFAAGVPGLASVNVNAFLEAALSVGVRLSLGVDTAGVFVDPATNVSVKVSGRGGLEGKATVLGVAGVSVRGSQNLDVSARLSLADPTPEDGKLYTWEVARLPGTGLKGLMNLARIDVTGDLSVHAEASVRVRIKVGPINWSWRVKKWSHDWNFAHFLLYHREPKFLPPPLPNGDPVPRAGADVLSHQDGQVVSRVEAVTGLVPPGKFAVVFVRPLVYNLPYWIQPPVAGIDPSGVFTLDRVYFGESDPRITPPGTRFEIRIGVVNSRAEAQAYAEGQRLSALPPLPLSPPVVVVRD